MRLAPGTRDPGRPAFTLIELLVVIAIIAILMALAVTGVFRMIDVQNRNNTETALSKFKEVLTKQWDKVVSDAKKEPPSQAALYLAGGDPKRAQVIWVKLRLMEAFPTTYAEVKNPPVYTQMPPGKTLATDGAGWYYIPPGRRKYMARYQAAVGTRTGNPVTESAACLLLALSTSRGGISLGDEGAKKADTDSDGLPEIVDDWGTPVLFVRFPTGNADLIASNPAQSGRASNAKFPDPLDPDGYLALPAWATSPNGTAWKSLTGAEINVYNVPVIVSAGSNTRMGLNPVTMAELNADAHDNVYSYRLKEGGGGN